MKNKKSKIVSVLILGLFLLFSFVSAEQLSFSQSSFSSGDKIMMGSMSNVEDKTFFDFVDEQIQISKFVFEKVFDGDFSVLKYVDMETKLFWLFSVLILAGLIFLMVFLWTKHKKQN